jgi:ABC-type multidrug transport system fused ATPase/permease subunit
MEPAGGTSGSKAVEISPKLVGLHDTNSSELSVSIASVSMLPHLEATNAERVLNEEKKKKREARKLKREAREKKKKAQQRLEENKARKEETKLKREARRKRREAKKKKEQEAKASNASSS